MKDIRRKAVAAALAGLVAAGPIAPVAAWAAVPSAGPQTGTGSTDVTVQLRSGGEELSGTIDPRNADHDGDGLGDNIAFTVPAAINFVAAADGTLTGPSPEATYIENESAFAIHASSFLVAEEDGWKVVAQGEDGVADSVDFQFGPEGDSLDAASYLEKKVVGDATKWNMSSARAEGTADRVQMATGGKIHNVSNDVSSRTKVATIQTFVTPGVAR